MAKKKFFLFRLFDWLFTSHPQGQDIDIQPAVEKAITALDNVIEVMERPEVQGLKFLISNEGQASIESILAFAKDIRNDFKAVKILPDVPEKLAGFRFANDEKRNTFYHALLTTVFTMFSDGKISPFEVVGLGAQIGRFIKEND